MVTNCHFLFDMDGVIINSMPLHTQSWKIYLENAGVSADSLVSRMHGKRNDQIVRDIFGDQLSDDEVFQHGAKKEAIQKVMSIFTGLPHRIEYVRKVGGVQFFNDSKATNVHAVLRALDAFEENII